MTDQVPAPDPTAVRVALWRALHVQVDPPPHVLVDDLGAQLAAPPAGWRSRPDMDPGTTSGLRAGHVAWARYVEDLVAERAATGLRQYVVLGAGLDTFAARRPEPADLQVFEIDRPGPQAWKRRRLDELGLGVPDRLHLVPVDFEAGESWLARSAAAGFDPGRPAVVACIGVSMYLSREANEAILREAASLAPGSTLVLMFLPPLDEVEPADRAARRGSERGARASGTPFVTFYSPPEMLALARSAGFAEASHVSAASLDRRYFAGRSDGLHVTSGADLLVATCGPA